VLAWQIGVTSLIIGMALVIGGPWVLIAVAVVLITWSLQ
jgi:hypothetical protein